MRRSSAQASGETGLEFQQVRRLAADAEGVQEGRLVPGDPVVEEVGNQC